MRCSTNWANSAFNLNLDARKGKRKNIQLQFLKQKKWIIACELYLFHRIIFITLCSDFWYLLRESTKAASAIFPQRLHKTEFAYFKYYDKAKQYPYQECMLKQVFELYNTYRFCLLYYILIYLVVSFETTFLFIDNQLFKKIWNHYYTSAELQWFACVNP